MDWRSAIRWDKDPDLSSSDLSETARPPKGFAATAREGERCLWCVADGGTKERGVTFLPATPPTAASARRVLSPLRW